MAQFTPEKKTNKEKKPLDYSSVIRIVLIVVLGIAILATVVVLVWNAILDHYLEKINIVTKETGLEYATQPLVPTSTEPLPTLPPEQTETLGPVTEQFDEHGKLNAKNLPLICDTKDVKNILVFATDARGNEAGRSDTMILVSVNEKTGKIILCSFMRDILVSIPGRDLDKLTHAHAYGGAQLLIDTFKETFNIQIDHYVKVNFYSFINVVDAMGGLDIEMTADEVKIMNWYLLETNILLGRPEGTDNLPEVAGIYHLNGAQALGYARNRYSGGDDFKRTERQRIVIGKMIDKAKSLSLSELDDLLDACLPLITTNMSTATMKSFINSLPSYLGYQRESVRVPFQAKNSWGYDYYGKMSIISVDFSINCNMLYELIYGEPAPKQNETVTAP